MEVKPNQYLSQDEEDVTKVVEEVLQDEKIQRIEDKNKKINKTIQTVLKKYNGQMDAEQIKEIVIKKLDRKRLIWQRKEKRKRKGLPL